MTIATTILEQLGGGKFLAMTGAKNLLAHESALSFKLPARFAAKGINYVKVTLNAADTYDVTFLKLRGLTVTPIAERGDIYADQLRSVFTSETGLDTSL